MGLDDTDRHILEELQKHGRLKNKALAERVGLSPSACFERVRRLEANGAVVAYTAVVDPRFLGAHFEGWAEISLSDLSGDVSKDFRAFLNATPSVVAAYHVVGPYDFLLHFIAPSIDAWREFRAQMELEGFSLASARLSVVVDRPKSGAPIATAERRK